MNTKPLTGKALKEFVEKHMVRVASVCPNCGSKKIDGTCGTFVSRNWCKECKHEWHS